MDDIITLSDDETVVTDNITVFSKPRKRTSPLKLDSDSDGETCSMDELDRLIAKRKHTLLTSKEPPEVRPMPVSTSSSVFAQESQDIVSQPPKPKKRRTKEDIERDKMEKEARKIEREMSVSIKSKCEQYTFCKIGKQLFDTFGGLPDAISTLFTERKIAEQWSQNEEIGTRIEWSRKIVQINEDEEGKAGRSEHMVQQEIFAVVVKNDVLKDVIKSKSLYDFVIELHRLSMDMFDRYGAQIVELNSVDHLALLAAQLHRSIARRERKRIECGSESTGGKKVQYLGEKGTVQGKRDEIVKDWWNKMLATVDRLTDSARRAIVDKIPDPIAASQRFQKMDYSTALNEVSEIIGDNGRRVGPAMAHRIVTMLTDLTGSTVLV